MPEFKIYKVVTANNVPLYVGITTQPLSRRLAQHKADAKSGGCSVSNRLCKKTVPSDLKAFHDKLRKDGNVAMRSVKKVTGTYADAHREELKITKRFKDLK